MKKLIALGLTVASLVCVDSHAVDRQKIQVTNNLQYGVAKRDSNGTLEIANICTFDVGNCQIGTVTKNGAVVPPDKLKVRINVNGVDIMPGETKAVDYPYFQRFGRGGAYRYSMDVKAFYDDIQINYSAPNINSTLSFPTDFTRTSQ